MKDFFEKTIKKFDKKKYKLSELGIGNHYGITYKSGFSIHDGENPKFVIETSDNSLAILEDSPIYKDQLYFVSLSIDDNSKSKTNFTRHFIPYKKEEDLSPSSYFHMIKNMIYDDYLFILPEDGKTTIYNSKTDRYVILDKFITRNDMITEDNKIECRSRIKKGNVIDNLTMYLDINTLEADSIYSELQDDNIPIIKKEEMEKYKDRFTNLDTSFGGRVRLTCMENALAYVNYLNNTETKTRTR